MGKIVKALSLTLVTLAAISAATAIATAEPKPAEPKPVSKHDTASDASKRAARVALSIQSTRARENVAANNAAKARAHQEESRDRARAAAIIRNNQAAQARAHLESSAEAASTTRERRSRAYGEGSMDGSPYNDRYREEPSETTWGTRGLPSPEAYSILRPVESPAQPRSADQQPVPF